MSVVIEARSDADAFDSAKKLADLLKSPLVKMSVEGAGIKLANGSVPVVYEPQREVR